MGQTAAQFYPIMARSSSSQLPLPIESAFTNNGLFADHFLTHRLRELPEWESAPNLDAVFQTVRDVWQSKGAGMSDATNEPQSEDDFIKPVLSALWTRDCYQVQVTIPNSDGRGQPDYAIFTSQSARDGAESLKGQLGYWNDVAVVGDAKKWRDSLDKARKGETPGAQMARYLYQTKVRWGILTNGPIWRLYEQDKARQGGVFYEANLEVILASEDKAAFKQFWLFFGRAGFVADASGASFVEKAFKGSANYATEVGDDLKESVYDALRALMNGFFEASANGLDRQSPDDLKRVHDTALIVLYRLLFILFAEDRALLPLDNPHYQPTSMRDLQREVNEALRAKRPFLTGGNRLWASFCDLCVLIDTGLEVAGRTVVPAYNGGLFSAAKHPEIAPEEGATRRWRIGDAALANVIDLLAYRRTQWDEPGRETVDYNSLEVQHLGSIYEGLLELQPLVAPRALVEVRDAGKTVWKDAAKIANARNIGGQKPRSVGADEVYLATNKGERKATGSYYTPKYIVSYIVDNTIGPLAHAASQRVAELRPAFDAEIAQLQTARAAGDEEAGAGIARAERALLAPYLELRVLDPAMGSGHFLVGAADELSLAMATDPNLPELETMAGEEPQAFYKRLVVEHCLYGVDLNPLAVELAKLSLWLHTVSKRPGAVVSRSPFAVRQFAGRRAFGSRPQSRAAAFGRARARADDLDALRSHRAGFGRRAVELFSRCLRSSGRHRNRRRRRRTRQRRALPRNGRRAAALPRGRASMAGAIFRRRRERRFLSMRRRIAGRRRNAVANPDRRPVVAKRPTNRRRQTLFSLAPGIPRSVFEPKRPQTRSPTRLRRGHRQSALWTGQRTGN